MELEEQAINVIRGLAMDAPEAAKSGHQGTAMALAPLAHVLWTRVMSYDAEYGRWTRRVRRSLQRLLSQDRDGKHGSPLSPRRIRRAHSGDR